MKIGIFNSEFLPYSQVFIKDQIASLSKSSDVVSIAWKKTNAGAIKGLECGCYLARTEGRCRKVYRKFCRVLNICNYFDLRGVVSLGLDVFHVHFGTNAVDLYPTLKKVGVPIFVTLHGFDINIYKCWWRSGARGYIRRSYPDRLLYMAKDTNVTFIVVSERMRETAISYGLPGNKIVVRYIGVDTQRLVPNNRIDNNELLEILCVGRHIENKGIDLLIRACSSLSDKCRLTLIGDGELLDEHRKLVKALNCNVCFLGACESSVVFEKLLQADVFCLPSHTIENGSSEGMPISVIEAQSCGIPVITSARGAVDECVVDGVTGYCFQEKSLSGLISCLNKFIVMTRSEREVMGRASRDNVVKKFNIDSCSQLLLDTYKSVLERRLN